MASKETEQVLEDELQALHHSIEQLNSVNSEVIFQNNTFENHKTSKLKRVNQADVQTQTPKKSRRSINRIPEDYFGDPDNPIDEILEEIAQRKNLTTYNVKHLLRNIISNESVQEMLKCSLDPSLKMDFQPKLTRSKTKEWLETQNKAWPTSAKKVSETHILMEKDFPDDSSDEDDEYRPNEDDIDNHSDEGSFLSSHASDIGSPSSSLAPFSKSVSESTDPFKRPFPIEQPPMHDDLIGSRTRSKLPLNDTPLEHLELAFVPPDISTDMYDSDCDNEEWRTFLKEFVCPPSNHFCENLDDEDADPEYNVLEEEEEVDAEELRADRTVQITKKEVSELLSELFEADFSSSDEENTKTSTELVRVREPADDILQTAMSDIMVQLETNSPSASKTPAKPTGIVQPLVPIREPVQDFPFTVSFPTLDCAPIEMFPQTDPVNEPTEVSSTLTLSPEATLLLNEQMRKHVQLLTQMHLITAQQSGLESITEECRFMLQDLVSLKQRVDIANLDEALDLVNYWEAVVTKVPPEELTKFQRTVITCGERKKFFKRSSKHPDRYPFNPKMVELMAESRVFLYPELLPKIAIFQSVPGPCKMSPYEEQLIAMGMEQFTPFCADLLKGSKSSVDNLVNSMISHYMLPHWTAKQIGIRIKNKSFNCKRTKDDSNPIKYYLKNKVAPPLHHVIQPFDRYSSIPLCDVPSSMLPVRWRELMLIHKGIRLRSRRDPHALRPLIPKCQPSYYLLYDNTPTPESAGTKPTLATKKPKPRKYPRTRSNKKIADCRIPHANGEKQASPPPAQPTHSLIHCNLVESGNSSPSYLDEDSDGHSSEMLQVRRKDVFPENRKRKKFFDRTTENSATDNVLSEPVLVTPKVTEYINQERNNVQSTINKTPPEIYPISEQLNLSKADSSSREGDIEESLCNGNSTVLPQPTVMSTMSSYHLDSIETDPESEPQQPLDASSPHNEERRTSPTTNQGAKRYFIIHRPNSNTTHVMHVWGPSKIHTETSVPLRTAADREASNTVGGPNTSSQGNQKSTSSCDSGSGNFSSSGQNASGKGTGTGNSGGDDGERPPSSPLNIRHVDENVVVEDDDDEEDSISFDFLSSVPLLTHSVPSKGRSPAHRHVRHQRNAKRILDSWMADDDPSQPRSDAYAQMYFMKVRNRLEQQNPLAFKEFVTTLGHFQSSSCSTLELYRKMESILKDHPDLMEEFVLFLSPEAAAQCGVQFQHFLYVRMREFFSKLKIHFKDSPLQLKRTLKTLQQIESSPSPNVSDIKNALLPLLKGNAHLTQAFLQLFLDDAPLPSDAGDFEDVNMDQINSGDEFEHVHLREATTQSKESEAKSGKRTGIKGSAKNKSKGKSWKKSS